MSAKALSIPDHIYTFTVRNYYTNFDEVNGSMGGGDFDGPRPGPSPGMGGGMMGGPMGHMGMRGPPGMMGGPPGERSEIGSA